MNNEGRTKKKACHGGKLASRIKRLSTKSVTDRCAMSLPGFLFLCENTADIRLNSHGAIMAQMPRSYRRLTKITGIAKIGKAVIAQLAGSEPTADPGRLYSDLSS